RPNRAQVDGRHRGCAAAAGPVAAAAGRGKGRCDVNLTVLLDMAEWHARRMLLEGGCKSLQAMYYLVAPPGSESDGAIIPCMWHNDLEKEITVLTVKKLSRKIGAIAALFVSESWMVTLLESEYRRENADPPSQDPRRIEVVTLVATDGRVIRQRYLQMIRATPGGPLVGLQTMNKEEAGSTIGGRMIDGIITRAR